MGFFGSRPERINLLDETGPIKSMERELSRKRNVLNVCIDSHVFDVANNAKLS
jgi:hypothetical protein